jgi:Cys-tRNA(Pro) deacylase
MRPAHVSETPATHWLRQNGVAFTEHPYDYVDRGGTAESARALGVDEHRVVKTLLMEDESQRALVILMHGDRQVSTKNLARQVGVKRVAPCSPETAHRHSGYQVGGTSPFGLRKPLPVYVERSILALERIYINGGKRGYLVALDPAILGTVLGAKPVDCAMTADPPA